MLYELEDHGVSTQNDRGEMVPAIPEPFFESFGRKRCRADRGDGFACSRTFWSKRRYREHYAYEHILGFYT